MGQLANMAAQTVQLVTAIRLLDAGQQSIQRQVENLESVQANNHTEAVVTLETPLAYAATCGSLAASTHEGGADSVPPCTVVTSTLASQWMENIVSIGVSITNEETVVAKL